MYVRPLNDSKIHIIKVWKQNEWNEISYTQKHDALNCQAQKCRFTIEFTIQIRQKKLEETSQWILSSIRTVPLIHYILPFLSTPKGWEAKAGFGTIRTQCIDSPHQPLRYSIPATWQLCQFQCLVVSTYQQTISIQLKSFSWIQLYFERIF